MPIRATYGLKQSDFDHRDLKFGVSAPVTLPPVVDLAYNLIDWVYDQGQQSSCVGNATASLVRFRRKQLGLPEIDPSRDFIYWNARALEGDTQRDAGCQIRNAFKGISSVGYCPEALFPFDEQDVFGTPLQTVFVEALHNLCGTYSTISQDHTALRSSLAANTAFVCGIEICQAFESQEVAHTGIVPMPAGKVLGGHAVFCVGYNDNTEQYKFLNSWGADWGQVGYFWLPYAFLENPQLASDFFTIESFK